MYRKLITLGAAAAVAVAVSAVTASSASAATTTNSYGATADPLYPQASFYPLHQDGFHDSVEYSAWLDATDDIVPISIEIRNSAGYLVRSFPFYGTGDYVSVKWGGRNTYGRLVKVGDYTISTVIDGAAYAPRIAHVRTGTFWTDRTVRHSGMQTISRSKSGACYFEGYMRPHLIMDSWGGSCSASYSISVPRNARNVSGSISAVRAGCCGSHFVTSKTQTASGFRFTARVWDWSRLEVRSAQASYQVPVVR
jgi:hypothetical protein